jgi:hypothetical protein
VNSDLESNLNNYISAKKKKEKLGKLSIIGAVGGILAFEAGYAINKLINHYSINPFTSEDALEVSTLGLSITTLTTSIYFAVKTANNYHKKR